MLIGNPMIFRELPLERAIRLMRELGYEALELWPPQIAACRTDELRRRLADFARSLGLPVVRLNAADADYFAPLASDDLVSQVVDGLRRDIGVTISLGARQLLSWEGRPPAGASRADLHGPILDRTTRAFEQALDYAKSKDVSISVEVHPFTLGIDLDWLIKLCDRLDPDRFGVTYDCCHFGVGMPDGYIEAIATLGPRIKHVHFSDSDTKSSELHFAPGTGCLDLDGIVEALRRIQFTGTMMLDLWLYPFPEDGTRAGVPYLSLVLERLGLRPESQGGQT